MEMITKSSTRVNPRRSRGVPELANREEIDGGKSPPKGFVAFLGNSRDGKGQTDKLILDPVRLGTLGR